ncbi:MAG TPA: MmgE/PrpD family protein [Thermodesulfobacteriota bacterium]|nr:MmgE/PrpD family protein [Thermodesulfobacteriota bacterium]
MTQAEQLAAFVVRTSYDDLSKEARHQLKIRILDGLGCAIGALKGDPVRMLKDQVEEFDGARHCTLIGGGKAAPDRAALYNTALVRYLDFNDSYLAKGETCHPSDNIGSVLAASEYAKQSGRQLLTALAVAYQVQCRLSDVAPVRAKGFDHTTQGSYAVAAGVSKALGLDEVRTANAIAICGTAFNALRVTRTGALSHWKGLAYPNTAFSCTHGTFLAMRGITGPPEVFEGNKGFMEAVAGKFKINWLQEDLERVTLTSLKRYNAEIHSQSVLEGVLELKQEYGLRGEDVTRVDIEIFDVAYHIIGGGEEGDKTVVGTKEEADHSLPYLVAVALLDGQVMPDQYRPDRIQGEDVQSLLKKVVIKPSADYSREFPEEMPCRVTLTLRDGQKVEREKHNYEGFRTRPMSWETAVGKFEKLAAPYADRSLCQEIIHAVLHIESIEVSELAELLGKVRVSSI